MALWIVLVLALVQGVGEFLPISSSGHLRIIEALCGIDEPQVLFDVLLHLGTLGAVVWVYRELLWRMLLATARALSRPAALRQSFNENGDFRLFTLVCLGMLPTMVIALLARPLMDRWAAVIALVGVALLVTASLLFVLGRVLARRARTADQPETQGLVLADMTWKHALLIGAVQGVSAAFRGVSRSGSTITGGVLFGLRQDAAATYSFLLSIPAILGALVVSLKDYRGGGEILVPGLIGAVLTCAIGIVALRLLLKMLGQGRLGLFSIWCLAVGSFAIIWDLTR